MRLVPLELFSPLFTCPQSFPTDECHALNTNIKCMIDEGADVFKGWIRDDHGGNRFFEGEKVLSQLDIRLRDGYTAFQ